MIEDNWENCYDDGWIGICQKESIVHPAKFSRGLIRRIYQHAMEEGWLKSNDVVCDCFGGVALGALDAGWNGINWIGIELESRFQKLGSENIELWKRRGLIRNSYTILVQGDSRQLSEHIKKAMAVVSSPPYSSDALGHSGAGNEIDEKKHLYSRLSDNSYGETNGQLGEMDNGDVDMVLASPPYSETRIGKESGQEQCGRGDQYSETPGQLGGLADYGVDTILASPPFVQTSGGTNCTAKTGALADPRLIERHRAGNAATEGYGNTEGQLSALPDSDISCIVSSPPFLGGNEDGMDKISHLNTQTIKKGKLEGTVRAWEYGKTDGQLTSMEDGDISSIISSPPFEESTADGGWQMLGRYAEQGKLTVKQVRGNPTKVYPSWDKDRDTSYAPSPENIGNDKGETFWSASQIIIRECYKILPIGGRAIWVLKNYVKDKQVVPFTENWIRLCEHEGFKLVHHHHAMLVKVLGTQMALDGTEVIKKKSRLSFFRRINTRRGSPEINFESVICMVKE